MRKLLVYLLLDVSGSMSGEPIEAVRNGMQTLLSALRQDPHALESAYLSVITFGSGVTQIVTLTELGLFQMPTISASGMTPMGQALQLLVDCIGREVATTTATVKGDWKPIVFMMSDGGASDSLADGLAAIKAAKIGTFIACAAGPGADLQQLKSITESVVHLDTADSQTIKAFFQWVSASIATTSQKVDLTKKDVAGLTDLPPQPPGVNVVL